MMQALYYECAVIRPQEELDPSPPYPALLVLGLDRAGRRVDLDYMCFLVAYRTTKLYYILGTLFYVTQVAEFIEDVGGCVSVAFRL